MTPLTPTKRVQSTDEKRVSFEKQRRALNLPELPTNPAKRMRMARAMKGLLMLPREQALEMIQRHREALKTVNKV